MKNKLGDRQMKESEKSLKEIIEEFRQTWRSQKKKDILSLGNKFSDEKDIYREACKKAYSPSVLRALKFKDASIADREKLKENSLNYLADRLNVLFNHTPNLNFQIFETWEQETINYIVKIYKDVGVTDYKYGNGQKLVNMAIKYVLSSNFVDYNHPVFKYCHIPIDGIIQKIAKKKLKIDFLDQDREPKKSYSPWSKNNNRAHFLDYQYRLRKAVLKEGYYSPLIWEIKNWEPQSD